jgi:hypothetical protein
MAEIQPEPTEILRPPLPEPLPLGNGAELRFLDDISTWVSPNMKFSSVYLPVGMV